jgi:DNA mismatch repair protein MutL
MNGNKTMNKISVLSEHLANLIAAGEVVERPLSVVKELVENAIDAQATSITITIEEAGLSLIEVRDNGIGMSPEDAVLAFSRHATSKIREASDLQAILSLGFRGEALPSIAAVSEMSVLTNYQDIITHLDVRHGMVHPIPGKPHGPGTTFQVRKLFVNTPARLKFIKHPNAETARIVNYITKQALARVDIAFHLIVDQKEILSTSGSKALDKAVAQLMGVAVAKEMLPLETGAYDLRIHGEISSPNLSRSTNTHVHVFVNQRVMHDIGLIQTIKQAYGHRYPADRYPVAVIHIDIDPSFIDVNVSPTKMQVQFSNYPQLKQLLTEAIEQVLAPQISVREIPLTAYHSQSELDLSTPLKEESIPQKTTLSLQYLTQFHKSYLLAQGEDGLYVIDQHAAAERIRYEQYVHIMKQPPTDFQQLLMPIDMSVSYDEMMALESMSDASTKLGFVFHIFGPQTIQITEVPTWFRAGLEEEYAKALLYQALQEHPAQFIDDTARLLACKRSIKFNDSLNDAEAQSLLDQLASCEDPFHCPHGRPTIIRYSMHELERFFGR